jgi:hypothetical protein
VREERLLALKSKSKEVKQVTPVVSDKPEHWEKQAEEVIEELSSGWLQNIYDPWWIAGFVEGDGSFQINDRLQLVFEVAQKYDHMAVLAIWKIFNMGSKVKKRADGYWTASTKAAEVIDAVIEKLEGKMLGMKSFELKIWTAAHNTSLESKRLRAKGLLDSLREATPEDVEVSEEGVVVNESENSKQVASWMGKAPLLTREKRQVKKSSK